MEYYWTLYNNTRTNGSSSTDSNGVRGHFGNIPSHAWDQSSWDLMDTHNSINNGIADRNYNNNNTNDTVGAFHSPKGPQDRNTDPHLTCLKLGKRQCFEDVVVSPEPRVAAVVARKGKAYGGGPTAPPRCQVEGCESVLANAKDYHRRHKVCEMHAKAPRVMVHGAEQRFCQQCSRFHGVAEFDEAKRSCRRRLAGHNQRRRKASQEQLSLARRHSQDLQMMCTGKYSHLLRSSSECALSLLSSSPSSTSYNNNPWNYTSPSSSSSDDLPARCSAALRELIAENRASVLARNQLLKVNYNHIVNCNNSNNNNNNSYRFGLGRDGPSLSASGGHVTLDLMQDPDSAFGLLSVHDRKEGNGEDCSELWRVPLGY